MYVCCLFYLFSFVLFLHFKYDFVNESIISRLTVSLFDQNPSIQAVGFVFLDWKHSHVFWANVQDLGGCYPIGWLNPTNIIKQYK